MAPTEKRIALLKKLGEDKDDTKRWGWLSTERRDAQGRRPGDGPLNRGEAMPHAVWPLPTTPRVVDIACGIC